MEKEKKKKLDKIALIINSTLILFTVSLLSLPTWAEDDDENLIGYDGIIKELSTGRQRTSFRHQQSANPFDDVLIHAGIGIVNSHISIEPPRTKPFSGFHKGIEATLGIDLFSRYWRAEGAVRSFGDEQISDNSISLKEFDLKIVYENTAKKTLRYTIGFGIAARYLDATYKVPSGDTFIPTAISEPLLVSEKHTTPSSLFSLGANTYISRSLSLGIEFSYRSALISETIDKSAFDALLRIDTHF